MADFKAGEVVYLDPATTAGGYQVSLSREALPLGDVASIGIDLFDNGEWRTVGSTLLDGAPCASAVSSYRVAPISGRVRAWVSPLVDFSATVDAQ